MKTNCLFFLSNEEQLEYSYIQFNKQNEIHYLENWNILPEI